MKRQKNNRTEELIAELKKLSSEQDVKLWKRVATDLEKPSRQRRQVNLYKIDKFSKEDEVVIVPGKVLGLGDISHKVHVAAFSFSGEAESKISAKGTAMSIQELMKKNPKAQRVRILG